tara:strand:+ start:20171 stop:22774 length:2604 start_codon:yes stop_codon:yes gene_type:complete
MQSSVLVYNLHKSLYQRLFYALVDSDYITKAITEEEIKEMLRDVSRDTRLIIQLKQFNDDKVSFISFQYPTILDSYFEEKKKEILEKHPEREMVNGRLTYVGGLEKRGEALANEIKENLKPELIKKYPDGKEEEKVMLEYLQRKHPEESLKDIKMQIAEYEKNLNITRREKAKESKKRQRAKAKEDKVKLDRAKLATAAQKIAREKQKAEEEAAKTEGQKLLDEWIKNAANREESYKSFMDLLNLVGSLYSPTKESLLRLQKFLNEKEISDEDKEALEEIKVELEKDIKNRQVGRNVNISPSQIEAKEKGMEIGQDSKFNTSRDKSRRTSIRINFGTGDSRNISNVDFFKGFETIDLTRDTWFNNQYLRPIGEYWLKKMGYSKSYQNWVKLSERSKYKYIEKVANILPEYPQLITGKKNTINNLVTLFNDVWDDYIVDSNTSEEDFAYFLQGIRDGLMRGKSDTKVGDFAKLRMFENDILPKLVNAVRKGVVIDSDNKIKFRLGPRFSKILRAYGNSSEVKSVIEDLIDIAKGQGLSSKYKGRDADELKVIEESITKMLSEEIYGETILSYIITTFMELYKSSTILRRLLRTDTKIDVDFIKPLKQKPLVDKDGKKEEPKPYSEKDLEFMNEQIRAANVIYSEPKQDKNNKKIPKKDKDGKPMYKKDRQGKQLKDKDGNPIPVYEMVTYDYKRGRDGKYRNSEGQIVEPKYKKGLEGRLIDIESWKKDGQALSFNTRKLNDEKKETKKSLDNLLLVLGEDTFDDILIKEDIGIILESLNKRQKKKIKAILNIADPTEYFGHDFLKLSELIRLLRTLGVVKGDKKLNKKVLRLDDENIKVVKLATRLRKDYEKLYRELREMIYPKSGE